MKKNAIIQLLRLPNQARMAAAVMVTALFALQDPVAFAQTPGPTSPQAPSISSGQLDSLVAPIALYPDQLLSQVLVASTYPQDVQAAYQWAGQNPTLQGKALVDAAANQPWDPSVQALVAFPQALGMLAQNISWTTQLGDAFLSQQAGVFDAVQRMRQQAAQQGKLQSTSQQTVTTATQDGGTYIQIEPANPQVVYVPQYEPAAIWGPAYYPYPAVTYPSTGALVATGLLSFGTGVLVGSLFTGGGWGWYPGWGHHSVFVNRTFIQNNHFNHTAIGRGGSWVHNPNRGRGEAGRIRPGTPGMPNRPGTPGLANRPGAPGMANRPGAPGMANRPGTPGMANRPGMPAMPNRPTVGQTEQRLGAAERANPGGMNRMPGRPMGGAQRLGPGAIPSQRPNINPGGPGRMPQLGPRQGGAQRLGASPNPGGMGHFGMRQGGAQRSMPRMGGGGGRPHGGGGGHFGRRR